MAITNASRNALPSFVETLPRLPSFIISALRFPITTLLTFTLYSCTIYSSTLLAPSHDSLLALAIIHISLSGPRWIVQYPGAGR